jgi:hypothetical protein
MEFRWAERQGEGILGRHRDRLVHRSMQKIKAKVVFPLRDPHRAVAWLHLKASVSSAGSAIAYSAYTFPDALVCSTFHECYVALAVLNTILSTGLSCYSRYWAF